MTLACASVDDGKGEIGNSRAVWMNKAPGTRTTTVGPIALCRRRIAIAGDDSGSADAFATAENVDQRFIAIGRQARHFDETIDHDDGRLGSRRWRK